MSLEIPTAKPTGPKHTKINREITELYYGALVVDGTSFDDRWNRLKGVAAQLDQMTYTAKVVLKGILVEKKQVHLKRVALKAAKQAIERKLLTRK